MQEQNETFISSPHKTCKSFADLRKNKSPTREGESCKDQHDQPQQKQNQCQKHEQRTTLSPLPTTRSRAASSTIEDPAADFHLSPNFSTRNCVESISTPSLLLQTNRTRQQTPLKEQHIKDCLPLAVNEGLNNGSKSGQSHGISEMQHNTSLNVGSKTNLHAQEQTISHEGHRACERSAVSKQTTVSSALSLTSAGSKSIQPSTGVEILPKDSKDLKQKGCTDTNAQLSNTNPTAIPSNSTSSHSRLVNNSIAHTKITNIGEHNTTTPFNGSRNIPKLTPRSISADTAGRGETCRGGDGPAGAGTNSGAIKPDQVKSKKFINHWKSAASMSKFGNRTKNLLGKLKPHSMSVDMVAGQANSPSPGVGPYR